MKIVFREVDGAIQDMRREADDYQLEEKQEYVYDGELMPELNKNSTSSGGVISVSSPPKDLLNNLVSVLIEKRTISVEDISASSPVVVKKMGVAR